MRSLPLVLLALAALLAPASTLAAGGATTPPSRSFVITGLVLGDSKVEVSGKLAIEGGQLIASVGCNTIGGKVTLDGDTVTIPEPLAMTEMGCPGSIGDAEAMLIKILQAGPFTITAGSWRGRNAAILVDEQPAGPGTGASAPPPDGGVVSSSPGPGAIEPGTSCPPAPVGTNGTTPVDVGPGATTGSGSGGAAAGSGGSSGSGDGSGTAPAASAVGLPAASAVDLPLATAAAEPGSTPAIEPGSSIEPPPPPPAPGATPVLGQTEPGPGIGTDPGVGKPADADPCAEPMAAIDQGFAGGGVGAPKATEAAAPHAGGLADTSLIVAVGLALVGSLVAGLLVMRRRSTRPVTSGSSETADRG